MLASTFLLLQGCGSLPTPPSSLAQTLAPLITSTVSGGIIYGYSQDQGVALYASLIRDGVVNFLTTTNLSAAQLLIDLHKIPISGVNPMIAALVVNTIVGVYDSFAQQVVVGGVANNGDLSVLLNAVVAGIDQGLSVTTGLKKFTLRKGVTADQVRATDTANYQKWRKTHPL